MITLAADIGGTRIKLALLRDKSVLARETLDAHSYEGLAPQLPRMADAFERLCGAAGTRCTDCAALGVAFPSLVDRASGRILSEYGKYADAPQIDLPRWAHEALGLELVIENDARLALLGEWKAGAGRGRDNLVMVTLGTGLGTSALMEGRLVRGKHGQAGVLGGHFTV